MQDEYEELAPFEVKNMMDNDLTALTIVDVRDADRDEGWIPGSMHLPTSQIRGGSAAANQKFMDDFCRQHSNSGTASKPHTLVWHCQFSQMRGPFAAARALESVKRIGVADRIRVAVLTGGFTAWRQQKLPWVRG